MKEESIKTIQNILYQNEDIKKNFEFTKQQRQDEIRDFTAQELQSASIISELSVAENSVKSIVNFGQPIQNPQGINSFSVLTANLSQGIQENEIEEFTNRSSNEKQTLQITQDGIKVGVSVLESFNDEEQYLRTSISTQLTEKVIPSNTIHIIKNSQPIEQIKNKYKSDNISQRFALHKQNSASIPDSMKKFLSQVSEQKFQYPESEEKLQAQKPEKNYCKPQEILQEISTNNKVQLEYSKQKEELIISDEEFERRVRETFELKLFEQANTIKKLKDIPIKSEIEKLNQTKHTKISPQDFKQVEGQSGSDEGDEEEPGGLGSRLQTYQVNGINPLFDEEDEEIIQKSLFANSHKASSNCQYKNNNNSRITYPNKTSEAANSQKQSEQPIINKGMNQSEMIDKDNKIQLFNKENDGTLQAKKTFYENISDDIENQHEGSQLFSSEDHQLQQNMLFGLPSNIGASGVQNNFINGNVHLHFYHQQNYAGSYDHHYTHRDYLDMNESAEHEINSCDLNPTQQSEILDETNSGREAAEEGAPEEQNASNIGAIKYNQHMIMQVKIEDIKTRQRQQLQHVNPFDYPNSPEETNDRLIIDLEYNQNTVQDIQQINQQQERGDQQIDSEAGNPNQFQQNLSIKSNHDIGQNDSYRIPIIDFYPQKNIEQEQEYLKQNKEINRQNISKNDLNISNQNANNLDNQTNQKSCIIQQDFINYFDANNSEKQAQNEIYQQRQNIQTLKNFQNTQQEQKIAIQGESLIEDNKQNLEKNSEGDTKFSGIMMFEEENLEQIDIKPRFKNENNFQQLNDQFSCIKQTTSETKRTQQEIQVVIDLRKKKNDIDSNTNSLNDDKSYVDDCNGPYSPDKQFDNQKIVHMASSDSETGVINHKNYQSDQNYSQMLKNSPQYQQVLRINNQQKQYQQNNQINDYQQYEVIMPGRGSSSAAPTIRQSRAQPKYQTKIFKNGQSSTINPIIDSNLISQNECCHSERGGHSNPSCSGYSHHELQIVNSETDNSQTFGFKGTNGRISINQTSLGCTRRSLGGVLSSTQTYQEGNNQNGCENRIEEDEENQQFNNMNQQEKLKISKIQANTDQSCSLNYKINFLDQQVNQQKSGNGFNNDISQWRNQKELAGNCDFNRSTSGGSFTRKCVYQFYEHHNNCSNQVQDLNNNRNDIFKRDNKLSIVTQIQKKNKQMINSDFLRNRVRQNSYQEEIYKPELNSPNQENQELAVSSKGTIVNEEVDDECNDSTKLIVNMDQESQQNSVTKTEQKRMHESNSQLKNELKQKQKWVKQQQSGPNLVKIHKIAIETKATSPMFDSRQPLMRTQIQSTQRQDKVGDTLAQILGCGSTISIDEEIKEEIKVELESNESEIGLNIYSQHSSVIFQQSQDDHLQPNSARLDEEQRNRSLSAEEMPSVCSSTYRRAPTHGVKFSYFAASSLSDDRWLCPICLDIFRNAVETPCCHNLFCEECIGHTSQCPLCNMPVVGRLRPNVPIRRLVNELSIHCPNERCKRTVKISDMDKHMNECDYSLVPCPISDACGEIERKSLPVHKQEECPFRVVSCILECGLILPLNEVDEHIKNDCLKFEVQCKNNCGLSIQRGKVHTHLTQACPLEIVECPNKGESLFEEGCTFKLKRREVEQHKNNCTFRKVHCQNSGCQASIIYKDLQAHDQRCLWKVIECDNKCGQKVQRQNLERHRELCQYQLVKCPYYDLGCKIEILRKEYKNHLNEESFNHSIIFIEGQKKKNREFDELKSEITNLRKDYDVEIKTMFLELNRVKLHLQSLSKSSQSNHSNKFQDHQIGSSPRETSYRANNLFPAENGMANIISNNNEMQSYVDSKSPNQKLLSQRMIQERVNQTVPLNRNENIVVDSSSSFVQSLDPIEEVKETSTLGSRALQVSNTQFSIEPCEPNIINKKNQISKQLTNRHNFIPSRGQMMDRKITMAQQQQDRLQNESPTVQKVLQLDQNQSESHQNNFQNNQFSENLFNAIGSPTSSLALPLSINPCSQYTNLRSFGGLLSSTLLQDHQNRVIRDSTSPATRAFPNSSSNRAESSELGRMAGLTHLDDFLSGIGNQGEMTRQSAMNLRSKGDRQNTKRESNFEIKN